MLIKQYFEKHQTGTLKDDEWESLAQSMILAKFDRDKMKQWSDQLEQMEVRRNAPAFHFSMPRLKRLLAAATLLLAFSTLAWYFLLHDSRSPAQQMAAMHLEQPFRLNQGNTRGEASVEKNRGQAIEAFEMKMYEKSLRYLRTIESEGHAKASDYFQMGLCLMYQPSPDYGAAVRAFETAGRLDPVAYLDERNWFTGLCQLMNNNVGAAKIALQKVIDSPSSRNREAALELIEKMK
ncbi:MAG: hypothetical protein JNJ57_00295 [Saprospiraceae bacterium]|nr:hypothetical protein [Saprospiraceae bacterium]